MTLTGTTTTNFFITNSDNTTTDLGDIFLTIYSSTINIFTYGSNYFRVGEYDCGTITLASYTVYPIDFVVTNANSNTKFAFLNAANNGNGPYFTYVNCTGISNNGSACTIHANIQTNGNSGNGGQHVKIQYLLI